MGGAAASLAVAGAGAAGGGLAWTRCCRATAPPRRRRRLPCGAGRAGLAGRARRGVPRRCAASRRRRRGRRFDRSASGVLAVFALLGALALFQPPGDFGFDALWIVGAARADRRPGDRRRPGGVGRRGDRARGSLALAALALWPAAERAARSICLRWSRIGAGRRRSIRRASSASRSSRGSAWRRWPAGGCSRRPRCRHCRRLLRRRGGPDAARRDPRADARIAEGAPSRPSPAVAALLAALFACAASRFQRRPGARRVAATCSGSARWRPARSPRSPPA